MWILSVEIPDQWKKDHVDRVISELKNVNITFTRNEHELIMHSPKVLQAEDLLILGLVFGYSVGLTEMEDSFKNIFTTNQ